MDATELLAAQHREVEALFRRFDEQDRAEARDHVVQEITARLAVHAAIEEQVFYPAVRDTLPGGTDLAGRSLSEHHEQKMLLLELERLRPDEESFLGKVATLRHEVEGHVEQEERDIFPLARTVLSADELVDLAEALRKKEHLAPVRPHPHAPDTPPFNRILGPVSGVVDRARNLFRAKGEPGERRPPERRPE